MSALAPTMLAAILAATDGDEAAAFELARRWEAVFEETAAHAERIRRTVANSPCRCVEAAAPTDGRCGRCWGAVS